VYHLDDKSNISHKIRYFFHTCPTKSDCTSTTRNTRPTMPTERTAR